MKISEFLLNYNAKATIKLFKWSLKKFFRFMYPEMEYKPFNNFEKIALRYLEENKGIKAHENNILRFKNANIDKPPKTLKQLLNGIKMYLMQNDIELTKRFWKNLNGRSRALKSMKAVTKDVIPSKEELKQILNNLSLRGRAFYLCLLSSGARIGEICELQLLDVNFKANPTEIFIKADSTKNHENRYSFISQEATEILKAYLKIRTQTINISKQRGKKIDLDSQLIFGLNTENAREMWNIALEKCGLDKKDERTKRTLLHPHVLRKYFRSKLNSTIQLDIVEAIMGHSGYLTEVYRRCTVKDLAVEYLKGEHFVTIFGDIGDTIKLQKQIEATEKKQKDSFEQNKILHTLYTEIKTDNEKLKTEMEKMKVAQQKGNEELLEQMTNHLLANPKILEHLFKNQFVAVKGKVEVVKPKNIKTEKFNASMYR